LPEKNKMKQYILESSNKAKKRQEHYTVFGSVDVFIKDSLPDNLELSQVLSKLQDTIRKPFIKNLDVIYVGDFEHLTSRDVSAVYESGAIYLTNDQDNNEDMLNDIVHEVAHIVEEDYGNDIYGDGAIETEFLSKRVALKRILRSHGYQTSLYDFTNLDFSPELDDFFYEDVGYVKLNKFVMGLFSSAYPATSLREYFATGFEEFYLGDRRDVTQLSPKLYNKLNNLNKVEQEYERN